LPRSSFPSLLANNTVESQRNTTQTDTEDPADLLQSLKLSSCERPARKTLSPSKKTKVKTRPEVAKVEKNKPSIARNDDKNDRIPSADIDTVAVTTESLEVFQRMFAVAPEDRDTKWLDFVSALVDAGFTGTHNGGSAVTFTHGKEGGAIAVHRRHPDPTISLIRLRRLGRRLSKWFGWSEDTFIERKKE
jgi:hypothetical protein